MKVVVGADHAGYPLKEEMKAYIASLGHEVLDIGADGLAPSDYPDFARAVAAAVVEGRAERGVLMCGSGVGASIAANKVPGIRAAICHDHYSAAQGVEHDDMNVLTLGARVIGVETAKDLVRAFLTAQFSNEERHVRRLGKVLAIEREFSKGG